MIFIRVFQHWHKWGNSPETKNIMMRPLGRCLHSQVCYSTEQKVFVCTDGSKVWIHIPHSIGRGLTVGLFWLFHPCWMYCRKRTLSTNPYCSYSVHIVTGWLHCS